MNWDCHEIKDLTLMDYDPEIMDAMSELSIHLMIAVNHGLKWGMHVHSFPARQGRESECNEDVLTR